jgi:hypothetical protein
MTTDSKARLLKKYCCTQFAEQAGKLQAPAGGVFAYPEYLRPSAQFEPDVMAGEWNINGCCGGGCFIVTQMKFCPYCGSKLT